MEIKTFDTILTELCDFFDELISPKKISRSNTNIIYLILKAMSKGFEIINNVCVVLRNKFDPANCEEEDLLSVASLVGTERLSGSASGLLITVTNDGDETVTLPSGTYSYAFDDDTTFVFEVIDDTDIAPGESEDYIAMSEEVGSFAVTEQSSITVTSSNATTPSGLSFSCEDNEDLLGESEESVLEFRQRIISDTDRQDVLNELEVALKNLPYLYDAKVVLNRSLEPVTVGDHTIPSYYMAIFYSGSPRSDIAELVASYGIYPTVSTADSVNLKYMSDVFTDCYYDVNIIPFSNNEFDLAVTIRVDTTYITSENAQSEIREFLNKKLRAHKHKDFVKEEDIYSELSELTIAGVTILNVDIMQNGSQVPYIEIPKSEIPYLSSVTFTEA